nr:docking protein 3 [Hymenolepis microstoma]
MSSALISSVKSCHRSLATINFIRVHARFGAVGGVLRVDAGRRCSTGDGHFFFTCSPSNGQPVDAIVSQIRQLALEAKQRLRQEQATRQQMLQKHSFSNESGPASLLPPPVPSKNSSFDGGSVKALGKIGNRTPSPKGVPRGASNTNGSVSSSWWSVGHFKRASSQPARRQLEEPLDKTSPQSEEVQEMDSASPSQKAMDKSIEESNGVFVALPGKATTQEATSNGDPLKSIDSSSSISTEEFKDPEVNGNSHQPRLYDNVPATSSETVAAENTNGTTSTQSNSKATTATSIDGWKLGSSLRPPKLDGRRIDDTNLPPAPPPPSSTILLARNHQNSSTNSTNGIVESGEDKKNESQNKFNGTTPPPMAPKPVINYSPKNIDFVSYRQPASDSSRFRWLSNVSSLRSYRPYKEESSHDSTDRSFTSGLLKSPRKSPPTKSLSFGSGVYETEEQSTSDRTSINMRSLDEVLQELRDANQNVSSAVQAAERQRRAYGFTTPYHLQQQQQQQTNGLRRSTSPTAAWAYKRDS